MMQHQKIEKKNSMLPLHQQIGKDKTLLSGKVQVMVPKGFFHISMQHKILNLGDTPTNQLESMNDR
jgi:hypothetical protein